MNDNVALSFVMLFIERMAVFVDQKPENLLARACDASLSTEAEDGVLATRMLAERSASEVAAGPSPPSARAPAARTAAGRRSSRHRRSRSRYRHAISRSSPRARAGGSQGFWKSCRTQQARLNFRLYPDIHTIGIIKSCARHGPGPRDCLHGVTHLPEQDYKIVRIECSQRTLAA